jgi:pimeloyl-ACP methyl ester carboxylesterase
LSKRQEFKNADADTLALAERNDGRQSEAQVEAFESGIPQARVIRLPHASHYVFVSNEADVLREVNAFLDQLP